MQNFKKEQFVSEKRLDRSSNFFCIKHEYHGKQSLQQLLKQWIIKRLKSRKMIP